MAKYKNDLEWLYPEQEVYQNKIKNLISLKKGKDSKYIRNSLKMLYHIYFWPNYKKLKCAAGYLFCIVEPDGTVLPCDRIKYKEVLPNLKNHSFVQAFKLLPQTFCSGCGFCGSLELTYLFRYKWHILKTIKEVIE